MTQSRAFLIGAPGDFAGPEVIPLQQHIPDIGKSLYHCP